MFVHASPWNHRNKSNYGCMAGSSLGSRMMVVAPLYIKTTEDNNNKNINVFSQYQKTNENGQNANVTN